MLRLWILNVGHGDSIVVQYTGATEDAFGVIDSNVEGNAEPKALKKLRELKATKLSFIALTHPHKDHYRGLIDILNFYSGSIKNLYTYPMGRDKIRLKKMGQMYVDAARNSGSATILKDANDFIKFMHAAHLANEKKEIEWIDAEGPTSQIRPYGFSGVKVFALLPLKRYKGDYFTYLDQSKSELLESPRENTLSLVLSLKYAGVEIILGGDGTHQAWIEHRRELEKSGDKHDADVCKLPHHGSKIDCSEAALNHIYGDFQNSKRRIALVSANGKTHPAPETLRHLQKAGILPFCTNLATSCGAKKISPLFTSKEGTAPIAKLINMHQPEPIVTHRQACQGDICVEINSSGAVQVTTEFDHPCMFRTGLAPIGL